jgi:hypothetical protein
MKQSEAVQELVVCDGLAAGCDRLSTVGDACGHAVPHQHTALCECGACVRYINTQKETKQLNVKCCTKVELKVKAKPEDKPEVKPSAGCDVPF